MTHANTGKIRSQETKDKISKAKTGQPSSRKNIPRTAEDKEKISNATRGIPKSDEHVRRIVESKANKKAAAQVLKRIGDNIHKNNMFKVTDGSMITLDQELSSLIDLAIAYALGENIIIRKLKQ